MAASLKRERKELFFFIALKYILYFPFCVVLKKITVLLMCSAFSFKFRYFNLPLSFKFGFVLFSFSDWNQWLMLAFFGLHVQSRAGVPATKGCPLDMQLSPEVKVALRKC